MLLLKNGKMAVKNGLVATDVLIDGKTIVKIGPNLEEAGAEIIELQGKLIAAGFVDVHVHLREPGATRKETIATGTEAAARGGYTTIAAMPNTIPVPDSRENLDYVEGLIRKDALIRVLPYASITVNEAGRELVDFEGISDENLIGFTDDGKGVQDAGMMYIAMKRAKALGKPIVAHCEDESLLFDGYLHKGEYAKTHGHRGIMSASESVQIGRDIMLAAETGVHYHVCHISTKESVALVRLGKSLGINVTAEVSPHHLILADTDIKNDDANYKMNPPLRSPKDREALVEGLLDGTIDMIATDHAPHTAEEKSWGMEKAPLGIVGLETAFPLLYTHFVKPGYLTLEELIDKMAVKPAKVFGLPYGKLAEGELADLVVIDLEQEMAIDPSTFKSLGKNTPFGGYAASGWPVLTIFEGSVVYRSL